MASISVSAQKHYQMLSSIGSASVTANNTAVTQTIGQQSVVGNSSYRSYLVSQGYQKVIKSKHFVIQPSSSFDLDIYPNPFNEIVYLRYDNSNDINVNIFDTSGKLVFEYLLNSSFPIKQINLAHLSVGVYSLHLYSSKHNFYTKLIKK